MPLGTAGIRRYPLGLASRPRPFCWFMVPQLTFRVGTTLPFSRHATEPKVDAWPLSAKSRTSEPRWNSEARYALAGVRILPPRVKSEPTAVASSEPPNKLNIFKNSGSFSSLLDNVQRKDISLRERKKTMSESGRTSGGKRSRSGCITCKQVLHPISQPRHTLSH